MATGFFLEVLWVHLQPRFDALRSPLFRLASGADRGATVSAALAAHVRSGCPLWVVTTFDRNTPCQQLIDDLGATARSADEQPLLVVVRDVCACDYGGVHDALARSFGERAIFVETTRHLGKSEFWRMHQFVFDVVRALEPSSVLCLQDDIELAPGWFEAAWSIIDQLDDPEFAALSLHSAPDDEPDGRWVQFPRQPTACGRAWLTQWLDLPAFIATPRLYHALDHRLRPILKLRWALNPEKSSGVGRQITRRLFAHDANVYRVSDPLAFHGSRPSRMNPVARARRPMDNRTHA